MRQAVVPAVQHPVELGKLDTQLGAGGGVVDRSVTRSIRFKLIVIILTRNTPLKHPISSMSEQQSL